jgi:hypothetical protein
MSNEIKQTAVDWFAITLYEKGFLTGNGDEIQELLEQFKEMEKEHELNLIKFTKEIFELGKSHFSYAIITNEEILELYNETYGGKK